MPAQLNFLSVEEGHFEGDRWVKDQDRNGDETNFSQYVLEGQIIRIRLNPNTGKGLMHEEGNGETDLWL